jgi:hypothetical protein
MGSARWSQVDWNQHAGATGSQSRSQIFTQDTIHPDLDPLKIKFRESCDSALNPQSTPIILAADETGSMGVLAEQIIKTGLGVIMKEIYDRKPVTDPHLLCMAIGDAYADRAPLQVTQFEASIVLAEQVKKMYLEGNGGGNGGESYPLAWFYAGYKTKCDAIRKKRRKGYLFTIGDESPHRKITKEQLHKFVGVNAECDMDAAVLLRDIQKDWNVFHLIVKPVADQSVVSNWRELLGERAVQVHDPDKLAEGIVSIIQVIEGQNADDVAASWKGDTAITIRQITNQLVSA